MRLLINASNLVVGGGLQVAASLLEELKQFSDHTYLVFLSKALNAQVDMKSFPSNFQFELIASPAALRSRHAVVKKMHASEDAFAADVVFSVFGPSYWRPKAVHVCGFALPWLVYPESPVHELGSKFNQVRNWLIKKYKWWHFQREVDYIWCETTDVESRLHILFKFPAEQIFVISNSYSSFFSAYDEKDKIPKYSSTFKLLTVSAYYMHKNIEIIKKVIPHLKNKLNFCFILTIPESKFNSIFNSKEREFVKNIGPISPSDCPPLYLNADAVFLPSLLECFSANYPEAMVMRRPIITSDLGFARAVVGDAGLYCNPLDGKDIAEKIVQLSEDETLRRSLVDKGYLRLKMFSGPRERAKKILDLCQRAAGSQLE